MTAIEIKEQQEPKVQQGSRILPKTRDNIFEVKEHFFKLSTPSSLVSDVIELVFSGKYEDEDALEQIKKYKNMVTVVLNSKNGAVA